jgi:hypothetical protein
VQRHQNRMGGKLWRRQDASRARRHALPARRHALPARRDARWHALPARRHALPARRDARWHALPARRRDPKRRLHRQLLADQAKNPGLACRGFLLPAETELALATKAAITTMATIANATAMTVDSPLRGIMAGTARFARLRRLRWRLRMAVSQRCSYGREVKQEPS